MGKQLAAVAASIAWLAAGTAWAEDDGERVRRAVDYALSTQLRSGLFAYDFDFLRGGPTGEDNIVRQAGTLFSLGEYLVETGDARVAPALVAGLEALGERSLPLGKGGLQSLLESAGVFSIRSGRLNHALHRAGLLFDPAGDGRVVADDDRYETAHTGATALALIAELLYRSATGDDRFAALREGWVEGLLALRVPGQGVRTLPTVMTEGSYVNGEAWLALASYHEAFPEDAHVAAALRDLEGYLLHLYDEVPDRYFYHWGAIASAARFRSDPAPRLADFASRQAAFILDELPVADTRRFTTCSLVEGLASAIPLVEASAGREALASRMRERVALELAHNRALQIQPGQREWALGGGARLIAPLLADHAGAFLAGPHVVVTRTDVTQHCISALLKARRVGPF